ncbi:MAG: response regulator [Novosphingobium sp.]
MNQKILLIDDDDLLCEVLADFLEMSGYGVIRAADGREGLARLDDGAPFDLVLLDLLMPEMDGLRFLGVLSESGRAVPPVLVLSASATASVVEALDFPSVAGIVRKPVQPAALLEKIAALIEPAKG